MYIKLLFNKTKANSMKIQIINLDFHGKIPYQVFCCGAFTMRFILIAMER